MTPSNWSEIGACISTGTNLRTKKEMKLLILELIKPVLHALPTPMPSPTPVAGVAAGVSILTVLMILSMLMYFVPSFIAFGSSPRHRNAAAIFVLNLFLGWTGLGWIISLVWAFTREK